MLYFANFIVLDPGDSRRDQPDRSIELITDAEYRDSWSQVRRRRSFRVGMGAEAVHEMLQELDLDELSVTAERRRSTS